MKRASQKNKRRPKKKTPIKTITYKIAHENSGDSIGTIKLAEEFKSPEEYAEFLEQFNTDPDLSPKNHLSLIDKFQHSKDNKKLRFTSSELKLLEKALHNSYSYLGTRIEVDYLKGQLAWANTAIKDKSNSYEKNLRAAGGRLGFTKGAKRPRTDLPFDIAPKGKKLFYDPAAVTSYYKELISTGCSRKDAVIDCTKTFSFPSNDACSQYLRRQKLKNIPTIREKFTSLL